MGPRRETGTLHYNVISFRVSDEELAAIDRLRGSQRRANLILRAFHELVDREEEAIYRDRVRRALGS